MHGISKKNGAQAIEPLLERPAKLCSVGFRESRVIVAVSGGKDTSWYGVCLMWCSSQMVTKHVSSSRGFARHEMFNLLLQL